MPEYLEVTVDKFTFKVAGDRLYTDQGVWAHLEDSGRVRVGLSDFLQQSSGDVAFADVKAEGTELATSDELAAVETIKVNISVQAPVRGSVVRVNPAMTTGPEIINQDPYGEGWLAEIQPADWEADREALLDAQLYFSVMKAKADEETKKR